MHKWRCIHTLFAKNHHETAFHSLVPCTHNRLSQLSQGDLLAPLTLQIPGCQTQTCLGNLWFCYAAIFVARSCLPIYQVMLTWKGNLWITSKKMISIQWYRYTIIMYTNALNNFPSNFTHSPAEQKHLLIVKSKQLYILLTCVYGLQCHSFISLHF